MTAAPSGCDTGLRVVGLLLVHLSLLHAFFKLLLGLFVLFFVHLLEGLLFLLLGLLQSLVAIVIGGKAAPAAQAWWHLRELQANRTAGRRRQVDCRIRQANCP
jgi:hypothetical protein